MKKAVAILLLCAMLLILTSCGGVANYANLAYAVSEIYTDEDIEAAMGVVKEHFRKDLFACVLLELTYQGDDSIESFEKYTEWEEADEVIVLYSDFYVSAISDVPGFNTAYKYENFNWILVRNEGEEWQIADCGY